jgi:hypothetical protein
MCSSVVNKLCIKGLVPVIGSADHQGISAVETCDHNKSILLKFGRSLSYDKDALHLSAALYSVGSEVYLPTGP